MTVKKATTTKKKAATPARVPGDTGTDDRARLGPNPMLYTSERPPPEEIQERVKNILARACSKADEMQYLFIIYNDGKGEYSEAAGLSIAFLQMILQCEITRLTMQVFNPETAPRGQGTN